MHNSASNMGGELSQLAKFVKVLSEAVVVVDADLTIILFNAAAESLFHYEAEDILGQPLQTLVPPSSHIDHSQLARAFISDDHATLSADSRKPMFALRSGGEAFPIEVTLTNLTLDGERYAVAIARDVSRQIQRERNLMRQTETDLLTGLFNRTYLERFGNDFFGVGNGNSALAFIDLDFFKAVNDELGHECGDVLLQAVAGRIRSRVKDSDAVVRFGGDEIIVLLSDIATRQMVKNVVEGILQALCRTFRVDRHAVNISASIGVALYPEDGSSLTELIRCADKAMYQAKLQRNCVTFYDELD